MKNRFFKKFFCSLLIFVFSFITLNASFGEVIYNFRKINKNNLKEISNSTVFNDYIFIVVEENADEDTESNFESIYDIRNLILLKFFDLIFNKININKQNSFITRNCFAIYTFICCYRN